VEAKVEVEMARGDLVMAAGVAMVQVTEVRVAMVVVPKAGSLQSLNQTKTRQKRCRRC
jgi:hypothetical protein